jgi:glycosyltransferase involved in cell wall biosynthesis
LAAEDAQLTSFNAAPQGQAPAASAVGDTVGAIVLYHPDVNTLGSVISSAAVQVSRLILIANDGLPQSCPLLENAVVVKQEKNLGLGAAYNLAAKWARERGATHLLLLDQDSMPASGTLAALREAFKQPGPVAATGPLWRDSRTGQDGFFVRPTRWGTCKYRPATSEIVPVDFLISSQDAPRRIAWSEPIVDGAAINGVVLERRLPNTDEHGGLIELLMTRDGPIEQIVHVYQVVAEVQFFDVRPESPTFGKHMVLRLGAAQRCRLTIPPLVAYSERNVGDSAAALVNIPTRAYDANNPDEFRYQGSVNGLDRNDA